MTTKMRTVNLVINMASLLVARWAVGFETAVIMGVVFIWSEIEQITYEKKK